MISKTPKQFYSAEYMTYIEVIRNALSMVASEYYKVRTTYDLSGIVRERVFCYELYHKIRCLLRPDEALVVHAEVDKSGHKDFRPEDQKNPDFVFHVPGEHRRNTLVVEVKGTICRLSGILKDFRTLERFMSTYGYEAGVFILYNHTLDDLVASRKFKKALPLLHRHHASRRIYLLASPRPGIVEGPFQLSEFGEFC